MAIADLGFAYRLFDGAHHRSVVPALSKKTPIEYSVDIAGPFFGKFIGLLLLFFYFHVTAIIIREYGEFVVGNFLFRTPIDFVMGAMVFVCAVAVRSGIAVLGRLAQILVPVVILLLTIIVILVFPDIELENMFPMFENGLLPSIMGAATPQSWFSECFLMAFLLPHVIDENHGRRWGNIAVVSIMLTLFFTNLATLFVFGNITASFVYPVISVARYISIADFLEHVEVVVMALWVVGVFLKISVFYYALVTGLARWLNLSQYEPLVFSVGLLLCLLSNWSANDLVELTHFLGTTGSFYLSFVQTVIPLFLLLVAKWRNRAASPQPAVSHQERK